jgi:hypothetical protein
MSDDVLEEAKEAFRLCEEREADNRREALEDLRFARLAEQWPPEIRKKRQDEGRPCLTINRLPSFIRQVVNDARQNSPSIKVHPADSDADPQTAEVLNGLIRQIEAASRAEVAYDTAIDFAVTMGFGYFRVNTTYADDSSFDLDLTIDRVANPFGIWGDPHSTSSDSSDWNVAFAAELMTRAAFEARYRGADPVDWQGQAYGELKSPWVEGEMVRVAEYWTREATRRRILMLSNQEIVGEDVYQARREELGALGLSVIGEREVRSHRVRQRILTGAEVLETRDWAGRFIPIVPVWGEEVNVEGARHLRSLVRDAKDPQRMLNYWRTTSTELVALAPKTPFIGPKGAFVTDAAKWASANTDSHAFIEYDGAVPPERQPFAGAPAGALQEAANATDDLKAVMGLFDASLGAKGNETSGRAILARAREGDTSTFHFLDNLARAIEHGGRILIDLIPVVYSGRRVIRILGPEGQRLGPVQLGPVSPGAPSALDGTAGGIGGIERIYDLGVGRYDVTVETGPSFTTRREEAANQMIELIRANPAIAPLVGDLLAKNLDWPGADEIARRLQALLPPQAMGQANGQPGAGAPIPPAMVQAAAQKLQQLTAELGAAQQRIAAMEADRQVQARKTEIDAFKAQTDRIRMLHETARMGGGTGGPALAASAPVGVGG